MILRSIQSDLMMHGLERDIQVMRLRNLLGRSWIDRSPQCNQLGTKKRSKERNNLVLQGCTMTGRLHSGRFQLDTRSDQLNLR